MKLPVTNENLFALTDQVELRLAQACWQVAKLTPSLLAAPSPAASSPKTPPTSRQKNCLHQFKKN
jgi:hypothetical protein